MGEQKESRFIQPQIGENISGGRRWSILSHYKRWRIKPTTDYTKCGRKIFDTLTEKQKVLLGFSSRPPAYGSIRLKTKVIPSDVPKDTIRPSNFD